MKTLTLLLLLSVDAIAQGINTEPLYALVYNQGNVIYIREKPNIDSQELAKCNSRDSVEILEFRGGNYLGVRTVTPDSTKGYMYVDFFQYDQRAVDEINAVYREIGNSKRMKCLPIPKEDKYQVSDYSNKRSTYSGGSSSPSRSIQTGPRGGQYYINKNGNKTYVKKKR
jgi:hypothetical protein